MKNSDQSTKAVPNWKFAITLGELQVNRVKMVRIEGRQIAVFASADGIYACDNRCPHEGYPLSEGSLSSDCTLTCNWHNWKFNLQTGDNLLGGDRLRIYPVEIRQNEIWIDLSDPPYLQRYNDIVANLRYAFNHERYDQLGRECARLFQLGADPMAPVRLAIEWSWKHLKFGWTHAYAGMADWLQLYDEHPENPEIQLACILEPVAHTAFDVLREPEFDYSGENVPFDEARFLNAIEREDEDGAIALVAGGLKDGLDFAAFEPALSRAALAHYNDFGHSLIYVTKAAALIKRLGTAVAKPLLYSLVREFIYATREDRIPDFSHYADALSRWGKNGGMAPAAANWYRKSINQSLDTTVACSEAEPETIYRQLLLASAISMLGFDIDRQNAVNVSVSGNVNWLDFTHGLTFANAVRKQCTRFPALWPSGLLQMACFVGRNAAYTTETVDWQRWQVDDHGKFFDEVVEMLMAHGQGEHIVSVHLLKTALAVRDEATRLDEDGAILIAALNRFLNSPLKRRLPRRVAHQSLQFVSHEA